MLKVSDGWIVLPSLSLDNRAMFLIRLWTIQIKFNPNVLDIDVFETELINVQKL